MKGKPGLAAAPPSESPDSRSAVWIRNPSTADALAVVVAQPLSAGFPGQVVGVEEMVEIRFYYKRIWLGTDMQNQKRLPSLNHWEG